MIQYFKEIIVGFFSILKGLSITFKHLFRKPVTIQYPTEKWVMPARSRNMLRLTMNEQGEERCTGCTLCAKVCPVNCISMVVKAKENKKRYADEFNIDFSICMFCGLCVEACNFDAIIETDDYESSVYDRRNLLYTKKELTIVKTDEECEQIRENFGLSTSTKKK